MESLFLFLTLFIASCIAQNLDLSVGVGGAAFPITSPQVIGYNVLTGKYKHVIILSIDGLHQAYLLFLEIIFRPT